MSESLGPVISWLQAHPHVAGLFTFIISAAESIAIIGTIVPGSIMMAAIGALVGAGVIPLWSTLIWAILGAIVGDGVSYWLGYFFKDHIHRYWPFRRYPGVLRSGEVFFEKYGGMSVLIGRFVGPVRALVPMVAGMLKMKPWKFILYNVISAIGWAPLYMLPGILVGAASRELPSEIAVQAILRMMLVLLFILLCLWFLYKAMLLISDQINNIQNKIWNRLKDSKYLNHVTVILKHHNPNKTHGQLNLAIYLVICVALLAGLLFYVKHVGSANIGINEFFFQFFRMIRSPQLDPFMLNMTILGQKQILIATLIVVIAYLCFSKRWWTAIHAGLLFFLASGFGYVIKNLLKNPRPWGILKGPSSYSLPSGHATLSFALYVGFALLLAQSLPKRFRKYIYVAALVLVFLISMSRLYLGLHWFTDVLAGWLLSTAVIIVVAISYQRRYEPPVHPIGFTVITAISLLFTFAIDHHFYYDKMKRDYAQINWPNLSVKMKDWWEKGNTLRSYRVNIFGFPSQRINIEWAGDLNDIKATLNAAGWQEPPERDWISILHRIADVSSTQYLPLIAPQYLNTRPVLVLTKLTTVTKKPSNPVKSLLVLRFYDSSRQIEGTHIPIYVGTIGIVARPYSWINPYKKRQEIDIGLNLLLDPNSKQNLWEWKFIFIKIYPQRPLFLQKIFLIREKQQ